MGSLCLSLVQNLRCLGLKREQSTALLVPPVLIVLVSFWVIYARWSRRGIAHWLLVGEGFAFLLLSIIDFVGHTNPNVTTNFITFKNIDLFIGALSFLPLTLYLFYLYFYSLSKLLTGMADRYRPIFAFTLLAFVPLLIFLDEIGSFFGVAYGVSISPRTGLPVLSVGFRSTSAKGVWAFLNSVGLALVTVVQLIVFLLTLIKLNPIARRKAARGLYDDPDDFPSGLLPSSIGFFLGMVESLVGFTFGGFIGPFARRIIKFVARSFLVWGASSDTRSYRFPIITFTIPSLPPLPRFRRRRGISTQKRDIRPMISKPRDSTFVVLTPRAVAFYNLPRAAVVSPEPSSTIRGQAFSIDFPVPSKAVMVRRDQRNPPQLDLRFSEMNFNALPNRGLGHRELSVLSLSQVMEEAQDIDNPFEAPQERLQQAVASAARGRATIIARPPAARIMSGSSAQSGQSDTLEAVQELASQFPGLPTRVMGASNDRQTIASSIMSGESIIAFADTRELLKPSRAGSGRRKPAPPSSYGTYALVYGNSRRVSNAKPPNLSVNTQLSTQARREATASTIAYQYEEPESAVTQSGGSLNRYPLTRNTTSSTITTTPLATPRISPADSASPPLPAERPVGRLAARMVARQGSRKEAARYELADPITDPNDFESAMGVSIPWLRNDDDLARRNKAYAGQVRVRTVPSPTPAQTMRDSVSLEPGLGYGAVYEAATAKTAYFRPAKYDSGVFGEDELGFIRAAGEAL